MANRSFPRLGRRVAVAAAVVSAGLAVAVQPARAAGAGSTLTTCGYTELAADVSQGGTISFGCDIPVTFTAPIVINNGQDVTIEAAGHTAVLDGNHATRLFNVKGGSLTLRGVTLRNAFVKGGDGPAGAAGIDGASGGPGLQGSNGAYGQNPGDSGSAGGPGSNGSAGAPGTDGQPGINGADASGGAISVTAGASLTVYGGAFVSNTASAGAGGAGGNGGGGGDGGRGGWGGTGGDAAGPTPDGRFGAAGPGGPGGPGAPGGNGGTAGAGGSGGTAAGGAIYSQGSVSIDGTTFDHDGVSGGQGGIGGRGGYGGNGGNGGAGGSSGRGWSVSPVPGVAGAPGASGGNGRDSANGGSGGDASGGAIDNNGGTLTVSRATFTSNYATSGDGGPGGAGPERLGYSAGDGWGGSGGNGGSGIVARGGMGGPPGSPGSSGNGGNGGDAGVAQGGAIATTGPTSLTAVTIGAGNAVNGGAGGTAGGGSNGIAGGQGASGAPGNPGGVGGGGVSGGDGGNGGDGGKGGSAIGGAVFTTEAVTVINISVTNGYTSAGVHGQGGPAGTAGNGGLGGYGGPSSSGPAAANGLPGANGTPGTAGPDGVNGIAQSPGIAGPTVDGLQITTMNLPTARPNAPYSASLAATGGQAPYSWSLASGSTLPDGITLSPGGVLTGMATTPGSTTFQVVVTDSASPPHTGTSPLTLVVATPVALATTALPAAYAATPYSVSLAATGGWAPFAFTATNLPPGLALDPATGAISGTASLVGSYQVTAGVTDALGQHAQATLVLTVNPKPIDQPTFVVSPNTKITYGTPHVFKTTLLDEAPKNAQVIGGASVRLWQRLGTTAWKAVKTLTTDANGVAVVTLKPAATADYRWTYSGLKGKYAPAVSDPWTVQVGQLLRAHAATTTVKVGATVTITGSERPVVAGETVQLQQQLADGTWADTGITAVVSATGTFSLQWQPLDIGTFNLRIDVAATATGIEADSAPIVFTIS